MNRLTVSLGLLALATAIGLGVATSSSRSVSAAPLAAPPVSRQQVLDAARKESAVALRIDRIEAKLTTFAELQAARKKTDDYVAAFRPNQELWVVAMSGDMVPQLARGQHATWAAFVTDATTGVHVATLAGTDGLWPPFFLSLVDRGT